MRCISSGRLFQKSLGCHKLLELNFYNSLNNGIAGIQSALCQGFAGINQTVNNTAAAAAMQNKDGSSGQYWTLKDVEEVSKAMSIDWTQKRYNIYDLYYVAMHCMD